jgi:hypothetical protein
VEEVKRSPYAMATWTSLALMISPPSTWTDAHDLMEGASERGLIRETGLFRNIGQRLARAYQEILGTFDPELHEPSVSRDTEARLE